MPLFMDCHQLTNVSEADLKKAHAMDLSIGEKYGVRYLQYWVNPHAGTVFCLAEGPDKETCELVHKLAHGNIACALTEVVPDFFSNLMATGWKDSSGVSVPDRQFMTILVVDGSGLMPVRDAEVTARIRTRIAREIKAFSGRELLSEKEESAIGIFNESDSALQCALELVQTRPAKTGLQISLTAVEPVLENGLVSSDALKLGHWLTRISERPIVMSSLMAKLCRTDMGTGLVRILGTAEEGFISRVFEKLEELTFSNPITVSSLAQQVGISQPQLYRKIVSVTGKKPNVLIRDLRLQRAMSLLRKRTRNVTQVAMEVGFSNPSYFARCFTKQFGCAPSDV